MDISALNERGMVLVGCGRMGGALLDGWLRNGVKPGAVHVIEPNPRPDLAQKGVVLDGDLPADPAVLFIAVKPQMMADVLPRLAQFGRDGTLVMTVAAGTTIATYEKAFPGAAIVRAMPNTPAAIGQGISAILGNARATEADMDLARALMQAVGRVVRISHEDQMDAVTAVSGSGPAYVFLFLEAMTQAGVDMGLTAEQSYRLGVATFQGASELAARSTESADVLRQRVTSKGGTTHAAITHMQAQQVPEHFVAAMRAAETRAKELAAEFGR